MNNINKPVGNEFTQVRRAGTEFSWRSRCALRRLARIQAALVGAALFGHACADDWTSGVGVVQSTGTGAVEYGGTASGDDATAVGGNASAANDRASALGAFAGATGADSTAVGAGAHATESYATSFGAQSVASQARTTAAGFQANASEVEATAVGFAARASGEDALAAGAWAEASGTGAVAVGSVSSALSDHATAFGISAYAQGVNASAIGGKAQALGADSTAIGGNALSATSSATSLGAAAFAWGAGSTALGVASSASEADATAIGHGATASHWNSVALGAGSATTVGYRTDYIAYGLSAPQSSVGEVNIGNRTLSGVAPGMADNEAVNVAQLKALAASSAGSVGSAVSYDRNADGSTNRNSVTLEAATNAGGTAIHNLAAGTGATDAVNVGQMNDAIARVINSTVSVDDTEAGVNGTTDGAQATGRRAGAASVVTAVTATGSVAVGSGAEASASNAVALGQNSVADRADTVSIGTAGRERQLTNVAAATQGTDAVNLTQLQQSAAETSRQANDYTDSKTDAVRRDGFAGTAAALAVAGLPQAVLPGHGMIALGGGTYGGQSAVALGVSQLSDNGIWAYKVTGTSSTRGQLGVSIGAGRHW